MLLFVVPIGYVLLLSVTDPAISLDHYRRLFTVPLYANVMVSTFRTALIVTLACLLLGYPLAYVMARRSDAVAIILLVAVGPELLDRLRGAHLRVARHSRQQGTGRRAYACVGWGKPPQLLFTSFSSTLRHDPYPAALHGARALRGDEEDRSSASARRGRPRCAAVAAFRYVFFR